MSARVLRGLGLMAFAGAFVAGLFVRERVGALGMLSNFASDKLLIHFDTPCM